MTVAACLIVASTSVGKETSSGDSDFFERRIRPLLIERCYECHSEEAGEQQGGLLLDRQSGWLQGGETNKAVIPGEPESSLLIAAVRYDNDDLQMPPEAKLSPAEIKLLEQWVRLVRPGPREDLGETEFSQLGDQDYLFDKATAHWAFQPIEKTDPPTSMIAVSIAIRSTDSLPHVRLPIN